MGDKRFSVLANYLRFDNPSTKAQRQEENKLEPMKEILESFFQNSLYEFSVSEYTNIDKMLLKFSR